MLSSATRPARSFLFATTATSTASECGQFLTYVPACLAHTRTMAVLCARSITTYNWVEPKVRELWVGTVLNATATVRPLPVRFAELTSRELSTLTKWRVATELRVLMGSSLIIRATRAPTSGSSTRVASWWTAPISSAMVAKARTPGRCLALARASTSPLVSTKHGGILIPERVLLS